MLTVRYLEREWNNGSYGRLMTDLLQARGEAVATADLTQPTAAAAMVLIRLDELGQAHVPLFARLVRTVLSAQQLDGGWQDPMVSALALRALRLTDGQGLMIDRGMRYLADLQKADGLWPAIGIRRAASDAFVSAWILFQLGNDPTFRRMVRYDDALCAMETIEPQLAPDAKCLWQRVNRRRPMKMKPALWVEPSLS